MATKRSAKYTGSKPVWQKGGSTNYKFGRAANQYFMWAVPSSRSLAMIGSVIAISFPSAPKVRS